MKHTNNIQKMHLRCQKLQQMGLEIFHDDCDVRVIIKNQEFKFDFSGIEINFFERYYVQKVLEAGIQIGEKNIKQQLKKLVTIGNDDE